MENASKALIIAGAILISILLISVGILVMNSTGNMQDEVGTTSDSMAIQTFNSNFTVYEGNEMSGSQVKSLLSYIKSSNASCGTATGSSEGTTDKYVYVTSDSDVKTASNVNKNTTYTVEVQTYSPGGYVAGIKITANT